MARSTQTEPEIARLIERIAASRGEVSAAATCLRARLDFPARFRRSLRSHPSAWFGASLVAGLLAAGRLFRRGQPRPAATPRRKGLAALALAGAASLAKSAARDWLLRESRKRFQGINRF